MQVQKYPKYIINNRKYYKRTINPNDIFFANRYYGYHGISLQVFTLSLTWPWILQQGHAWRPRSFIFSILCKMSHFRPWYIKVNWRIKTFVASKKRKHFNITNCVKYFYNNELVFICFIDKMQHQTEKTDMYLEGF